MSITEGRVQRLKGAVKPLGEARPAWKVLARAGQPVKCAGFEFDNSRSGRDKRLKGVDVGRS